MPVVVFANPKGGAGKSTSAVILSTELARKGAAVTILDADPNKPVSTWAKLPNSPSNIAVLGDVSETSIIDEIEAASARTPFVVVDLEGTASMMVAYAISRADLVIIPVQGSQLDAAEAAKAIKLIKQQERAFHRSIPFAILFTRTNAAIKPRTLLHIQEEFATHGVRSFRSQLNEREAFRALFSFGGTLETLDAKQVGNLSKAISNARAYTAEVVAMLRGEAPPKVEEAEEIEQETEEEVMTHGR
jgi:chromosome partitioning protein